MKNRILLFFIPKYAFSPEVNRYYKTGKLYYKHVDRTNAHDQEKKWRSAQRKGARFLLFLGLRWKLLKSEISPVTFLDKRFLKTPQKIGFIKRVDKG